MKSRRRSTNELEFQGQVVSWLNENIAKHSGMGLDQATQEKPRISSGKRNDLVVWHSRAAERAFLSYEPIRVEPQRKTTFRRPNRMVAFHGVRYFSLTPPRRPVSGVRLILSFGICRRPNSIARPSV